MSEQRAPLVGVYPGTFDPITFGHTDIIIRAAKVLDRLIIAVANNPGKGPLFSPEERVQMVSEEIAEMQGYRADIEVRLFSNLLVHLCQEEGASVLVRGLRAVSDFDYEFQMAAMNARQDGDIETVFFMASENHLFISSHFVKEIGRLDGDISSLVSARVKQKLMNRFAEAKS